jgi:hypothetical protein
MVSKTYEQCVSSILQDIEKSKNVIYEDRKSVRKYNAAMDRIIEHCLIINELYPGSKDDFFQMIYAEDPAVVRTIASLVINNLDYPNEKKREAIGAIKRLLSTKKVDRLAEITLSYAVSRWEIMYPESE